MKATHLQSTTVHPTPTTHPRTPSLSHPQPTGTTFHTTTPPTLPTPSLPPHHHQPPLPTLIFHLLPSSPPTTPISTLNSPTSSTLLDPHIVAFTPPHTLSSHLASHPTPSLLLTSPPIPTFSTNPKPPRVALPHLSLPPTPIPNDNLCAGRLFR